MDNAELPEKEELYMEYGHCNDINACCWKNRTIDQCSLIVAKKEQEIKELEQRIAGKGEELMGALARGYCTKRNEKKILDPDLIEDMVKEVLALSKEQGE